MANVKIRRKTGSSAYDVVYPTADWSNIDNKPATFTPTSHTHGNITNGGTITADTAVASGQKLVLVNGSDAVVRSSIALGTGTTTFLRNDGTWSTPAEYGTSKKAYTSITGTSGAWYDLFTVADGTNGALFVSIQTYAHDDLLFTVGTGYGASGVGTITILNCVYNPSGPYASITGVRVTSTGLVQAQFTWASGPTVDIDVAVYGSGTLPTLSASLIANATSYTIDDTVSITGLQGKIRSENGFVQGSTPIPSGTGTLNELTYWSGANTIGTLTTGTYPSLTELSYIKGLSSAVQTQLNNKAATSHTHSIGYYNSAITSDLDTLFSTGEFGFANTTTGRPEDYGQGINIVNTGTAYNGTSNWITQLAFGTTGSTSYFRTKVNTGAWTAWRKLWNDANDGTGSGLDADLLDGNHSSAFAASVHTHDVLSERGTITYGLSGLQWNDTSGVGGTGLNGAAPNNPTNEWWHHLIMNHPNASGYYVDIAAAFHTDDLYLRRNVGGTLSTWRKIWTEGNDGTGSGLDADLLDGNHASAFLLTTARNAANGVAPLDATSKVPLANLPDFITGAGRGFYLVGTISGAVSLSAATTGLVAQLVALSGGDYENMYGYMWTAAAEVTLTWTDQTTLGPVYQYHVLTPGDEGDSTSPVTLEAGDMIVFTKYSDTAGDNNDQEFTFSVINSSDPRFANYVPLTGGTLTGNLTISNTLPKLFLTDTDNNSDYSIWNNNGVFSIRDETNSSMRLIINSSGNIGIGTTSPASRLHVVSAGNPTITLSGTDAGYTSILDLRSAGGGTSLINANGGANILRLQTNSVDRVWINDVGNVGIATTTPSEKLEVSGNAKATTFISTQATGTAPLTVASTTAVTNLNADLLDGNHAAAFALASHTHAIADVTSLQTSLDAKAPLASPTLTGTPAAPTAAAGTNTTQIATTAFITSALNLILPYGNIEKRKDTGLINIPYTISGSDFFVTDPISDGLKQMIINENIKIQLWMYKMALRKASMKGPYDANGNVTGRQTVRKFTHAEDLTGTPSLLTGHTRPAKLGDGVKMLSLQSDNASGTSLFKGTQNSDINATDVTFVTNNNDHYKGYVKTEVVVTAAMIQADNRIKIPMYDIATSWLINNTFIGIASPQGYYTIYCKKQTPGANGAIYQTISFNATNLPTVAANRNAFLAVRGVGMGGMNAQQVGPYAQGGGVFNGQYTPNKTLTMNLSGTIPGIIPFVTSRALQFRLVASTNGTSFIYGPPTSARGVFRCLGDGTAQSGMVLRLDFVNDTRKNLVPSYFMSNLANLL